MVIVCESTRKAFELTHSNVELTTNLQQTKSKLQEVEQRLQEFHKDIIPLHDKQLWEDLQAKEATIDEAKKCIEVVDNEVQWLRNRLRHSHQQEETVQKRFDHMLWAQK